MKYYILAQTDFLSSLTETLTSIKESGFDGVFFNLEHNRITYNDVDLCRRLGLDIETLHLPYGHSTEKINMLWSADPSAEDTVKEYKRYIDFAVECNIDTVVMHASNGFHPPRPSQTGLKYFEMIAEYCQKRNIVLAIENIKSTDHLIFLLNRLQDSSVRFCFDIGHANAFTNDLHSEIWSKAFPKLHCIHIHDNDGKQDEHLLPGMGTIDWAFWKDKLSALMPYKHLTFELYYKGREKHYENIDQAKFYEHALYKIKEIWE